MFIIWKAEHAFHEAARIHDETGLTNDGEMTTSCIVGQAKPLDTHQSWTDHLKAHTMVIEQFILKNIFRSLNRTFKGTRTSCPTTSLFRLDFVMIFEYRMSGRLPSLMLAIRAPSAASGRLPESLRDSTRTICLQASREDFECPLAKF